ncbi:S-phase kinase-associated protein 1 isoform X2 [Aethina tumida]|uniref:S-phase kinase-associated protein 1 isoform X2 n=1 Tax=Aethina tumida TaxID=116153 RepID=UPI00214902E1|nr:S-phase kinase-associated protein 1 isoform X2 [Aethina tumida]
MEETKKRKSEIIKLRSTGEIIEMNVDAAKYCSTLKDMIDNLGLGEEDDEPLSVPINTATLNKVMEWVTFHKEDPPNPENLEENGPKKSDDICKWDANFVSEIDDVLFFDMMMAANYLNIKDLIEVLLKTLANNLKTRNAAQIREKYNIQNDIGASDAKRYSKEVDWFFIP